MEGGGEGLILPKALFPTLCCPSLFFLFIQRFLSLHQLVAWAGRLVVVYCVLRGPVHSHRPDQATAADLKEIYEISDAAVAKWGKTEQLNILVSFRRLDHPTSNKNSSITRFKKKWANNKALWHTFLKVYLIQGKNENRIKLTWRGFRWTWPSL